jgi:hypothetical protein
MLCRCHFILSGVLHMIEVLVCCIRIIIASSKSVFLVCIILSLTRLRIESLVVELSLMRGVLLLLCFSFRFDATCYCFELFVGGCIHCMCIEWRSISHVITLSVAIGLSLCHYT